MNKILYITFGFFMVGCNANETLIDSLNPEFETMSFDVVQKKLVIEQDLPNTLNILVSKWFDEKVKINGFNGDMIFTISDYKEETSLISEGKRIDLNLSFNLLLRKPLLSQQKLIQGNVSSYGTISGDFSLKDFDTVIKNTQIDLILRLSRDLQTKI
tara:strand:- start:405 stop:875 length:471 start_codon:yes stop_codon:yes gene_type:complete